MSRRRFRRRARHAGARLRDARRADVCRGHHPGAQVHVGGARRRAAEAGDRAEGRPARRGGPGRGLAYRLDGGLGRGLRCRLRARRAGARPRAGRAVRRRRDAGPRHHAAQRAAGDPDQRRRRRHHRHRPADGRGRRACRAVPRTIAQLDKQMPRAWSHANPVDIVGDADGARYAAAVDALADDRGRRRGAGDERADGAHLAGRGGARRRRRARRQGGAGDRLLDRRPRRAGRPRGPARGRHPGLRHAAARRARLHAHRAVSPRPARAAAHAALGARGALGHAAGARHRARRTGREARDPDRAGGQARAGGLRHSRRADRGRARRCRGGGGGDADRLSRRGEGPVARDHPQERRGRRRARPRLGAGGRRRRAQR